MNVHEWTPHPVLKVPTRAQCLQNGPEWTEEVWFKRETLIKNEKIDRFRHGFHPETWKQAVELLAASFMLVIFGGNGSAKTWFGAWLGIKTMLENPECMVLWLHESEPSSRRIQQPPVYEYLPAEIRPTDENKIKRGVMTKLKYSKATGFSENTFVLPNGSMGVFGSYSQDVEDYEGDAWKLVIADENLPLAWLNTLQYRLPRRGGKLIWTFTPIRGITPAVKHVVQGAVTIESRRAEMLPETHRAAETQDWPAGHMPYIQKAIHPRTHLMYWPTSANPWSGYDAFRLLMLGKSMEEIERRGYGYARNIGTTLFPRFDANHLIEPDQTPQACTHYVVMDPALERNCFITWIDVDKHGRLYVVDEWPDYETYGEWAVPSDHPNRFNGDPGPAQPRLGWGIVEYKRLMLTREGGRWDERKNAWDLSKAKKIERRLIDPRAGAAEHIAEEEGESSIIFRFAEDNFDRDGKLIGPALDFEPCWTGKQGLEQEGIDAITDLLAYNTAQPLAKFLNEPRLRISARCMQTIWALQNYSRRPGQGQTKDEACKDPIDNLRYGALAELEYIAPRAAIQTMPSGYGQRGSSGLPRSARIRTNAQRSTRNAQ